MHPDIAAVLAGERRWAVVCGDNSPILADLPDGCVDHVVTDPPYDEYTHSSARTTIKGQRADIEMGFAALSSFDFVHQLVRVARRWSVCFCAVEQLGSYKAASDGSWVRGGVWHRTDGTPQLSADRPAQAAEGIAIMHGGGLRKRWNSGGKRGMWVHGVERHERVHPTQKPIALMLELLADFTDPGDVILDPFCGSGTTGVACLRHGRRFIGIEMNEAYADIARERLRAEEACSTLAAQRAGQIPLWGKP